MRKYTVVSVALIIILPAIIGYSGSMSAPTILGGADIQMSSTDDQKFSFTATPPLSPITITAFDPQGLLTNGGTMFISIPEKWDCKFDISKSVSLSGIAAVKIDTPVYINDGHSLALPIKGDFVANDVVIISGLYLEDLRLVSPGTKHLELDFDGDGTRDVYDTKSITVEAIWSGGSYDGWDCRTMVSPSGLGGALVELSSGDDQTFDFTAAPWLANLTIYAEEPQGAITNGGQIRISVPAAWACRFDTEAAVTFSSNAQEKVGVPLYSDDGRSLIIPVIEDFTDDDALEIAGLRLLDLRLVSPDTQSLELDFDGDGNRDVCDQYAITVRAVWSGGSYDGWDCLAMEEASDLRWAIKTTVISIR